jgi:hypothetical protein
LCIFCVINILHCIFIHGWLQCQLKHFIACHLNSWDNLDDCLDIFPKSHSDYVPCRLCILSIIIFMCSSNYVLDQKHNVHQA